MGMNFVITATASAEVEDLDISGQRLDAEDILDEAGVLGYGSIEVMDASVTGGSVTIEAQLRVADVEVPAKDIDGYDAGDAFSDVDWNVNISDAEFEVTESPSGFDVVEEAVGRETALSVYAALDAAGFEVG